VATLVEFYKHVGVLSETLLSKVQHVPSPDDPRRYFKAMLLYYVLRGNQTMKAIALLVRSEFTDQSMALARGIVEMGINTEYASKDPEKRGQRYMEYDFVLRKNWLEKAKKYKDFMPELLAGATPESVAEIENGFKEVEGTFQMGRRDSWSGETIAQMARTCGAEWFYEIVYSFLCESSHNAVRKMKDYFEEVPGKGLAMKSGPDAQYQDAALATACSVFLMILSHADEELKLGFAGEIGKLEAEMKNIH
jgi:hypothetical protein